MFSTGLGMQCVPTTRGEQPITMLGTMILADGDGDILVPIAGQDIRPVSDLSSFSLRTI